MPELYVGSSTHRDFFHSPSKILNGSLWIHPANRAPAIHVTKLGGLTNKSV